MKIGICKTHLLKDSSKIYKELLQIKKKKTTQMGKGLELACHKRSWSAAQCAYKMMLNMFCYQGHAN